MLKNQEKIITNLFSKSDSISMVKIDIEIFFFEIK